MKAYRHILTFLLVLLLTLSMIPCGFATEDEGGENGEYEETDSYIYHFYVADDGYNGPKFQYFSPYYAQYNYNNGEKQGRDQIFLYTIYNSVTGEVIPAYCTDIFTGAYEGNKYRRLNLEDSTYAASSGPLLRAIMLNGFYLPNKENETAEQHLARVNENLARLSAATGVEDLTIGEAIAGTQLAIWRAAHGPLLKYDPLVYKYPYGNKTTTLTRYYDICNEERANGHYQTDSYGYLTAASQAYLTERIQDVIDYLLALEPVPAQDRVVSTASFTSLKESAPTLNEDGTYDLHLFVTVDVDMAPIDQLTLTAMADTTHYAQVELVDGEQKLALTIKNVPAEIAFDEVTLAIDGVQSMTDVMLFEAQAGVDKSQSMLGIDDSQIPAHAMLTAKPKRDPIRAEKDVIFLGNDVTTQNVNADHTWIIGGSVPEDMAGAKSYTVYDSLDPRLDFAGNLRVVLESYDKTETLLTLEENTHYTLLVVDGDSTKGESDAFRVSLTEQGIATVVATLGDRLYTDYMIRVYFDAKINKNAEMSEDIPNQATVEYVNVNDLKYTAKSDEPVVYTGAANLLKVDAADNTKTLAGATFKVFRNATEEEVANQVEGLTYLKDMAAPVVPVDFYNNPDLAGEKVYEVTSDDNGRIAIYGIAHGKYYLLETASPPGYNLMPGYMEIEVNETSHLEENVLVVENTTGGILPGTGGMGTILLTFGGGLLILASGLILIIRKRMANAEG